MKNNARSSARRTGSSNCNDRISLHSNAASPSRNVAIGIENVFFTNKYPTHAFKETTDVSLFHFIIGDPIRVSSPLAREIAVNIITNVRARLDALGKRVRLFTRLLGIVTRRSDNDAVFCFCHA